MEGERGIRRDLYSIIFWSVLGMVYEYLPLLVKPLSFLADISMQELIFGFIILFSADILRQLRKKDN